jgi:hypothetical protein
VLWLQPKGPFQFYDRDNDFVSNTTIDWRVFHTDIEKHVLLISIEENSDRVLVYDVIRPGGEDWHFDRTLGEQFIGHILDYCIQEGKAFEVQSVYDKSFWTQLGFSIKTSDKDTIYATSEELKKIRSPQ